METVRKQSRKEKIGKNSVMGSVGTIKMGGAMQDCSD